MESGKWADIARSDEQTRERNSTLATSMKEISEIENAVKRDIKFVSADIDKKPLESKKFWALLVSILSVFVVLLTAGIAFLHIGAELAAHAMDVIVWLAGIFITGQGAQDVMKAYKGKSNAPSDDIH